MPIANFMVGWANLVKANANTAPAFLAAGSSNAGLPITNLQVDQGPPAMGWQTANGVTSSYFTIDARITNNPFRLLGLFRTNLTASATVRWQIGPFADGTGGYDTGVIAANVAANYGQSVFVMPSVVTQRYARCDISDPGNPDGFLNVSLAYAGPVWQGIGNFSPASAVGRNSSVVEVVTRSGQEFPFVQWASQRRFEVSLSSVRDAEVLPSLAILDAAARLGGNILFIPDLASPTINREAVFGRVKPQSDVGYTFGTIDRRTWRGTVTERL